MFKDCIKNSFTLSIDSGDTDSKPVNTQLDQKVDLGSAQNINSPKFLMVTHQTDVRIRVPNNANNVADIDNLNVRKYHVDIDGVRYPRDGASIDNTLNDYVDQYKDLKLLYKENVAEEILTHFISYTDKKKKYPMEVINLGFQVDHIIAKKIQLFEEYRGATNNARLFTILVI